MWLYNVRCIWQQTSVWAAATTGSVFPIRLVCLTHLMEMKFPWTLAPLWLLCFPAECPPHHNRDVEQSEGCCGHRPGGTQGWHTTSSLRAIWRLNFSYENLTWLDLNWVAGCIQKKEQDLVSFCSQGKAVNLTSHTYSHWTFVDLSQDVDLIAFPQISCEFPQKWLNTWHPRPQFNHRHSLTC